MEGGARWGCDGRFVGAEVGGPRGFLFVGAHCDGGIGCIFGLKVTIERNWGCGEEGGR